MLTDLELINLIRTENSPQAFNQLSDSYENIFYNVVHNYTYGLSNVDKQHLLDQKDFLFMQCINKFDPTKKAKFSTMIGNYARYMCLNYAKKHSQTFVNFDIVTDRDIGKDEIVFDNQDIQDILSIINSHHDPRVSKIFNYRYDFKKGKIQNWKLVSKKLREIDNIKLSDQGCINIHNKVIKQVKRNLIKES